MTNEEGEEGEEGEENPDDGEGPPEGDMGGKDMSGGPPMDGKPDMMGKPPMKPGMGKPKPPMVPSYMKKEAKEVLPWKKGKEDADDKKKRSQNKKDGADNDEKDTIDASKKKPGFCPKCKKMGSGNCCSKAKKMTKEQTEFLNTLTKMTGGNKFIKNEVGEWVPVSEDYLIDQDNEEPQAGEVGHAPSQYMGMSGGLSSTTTYQEWLNHRRSK